MPGEPAGGVDSAWPASHVGQRVRVDFLEGSQHSIEGLLRDAQGRHRGKVLTDDGNVVFFPLEATFLTVLGQVTLYSSEPAPVAAPWFATQSEVARPVASERADGEQERWRSSPSTSVFTKQYESERAWLRDAQRGRARARDRFVDGQCRQHALSTVLAPMKFTWGHFTWHCGKFDEANGFEKGTSAKWFVVGDDDQNIFSFILREKGLDAGFIGPHLGSAREFEAALEEGGISRAVVFSDDHAWAVRLLCGRWYSIDGAMGGIPTPVGRWTDGLGYVYAREIDV
mmetsp:Transcript_119019/g.237286  ORF Transcript_119019/g.237286 Transcript_119019/m.237286 type:complete len:285 (+) Transcript_119019:69-923(+)